MLVGRVRANAAQLSAIEQRGLVALVDREKSLIMAKGEHRRTASMVAARDSGGNRRPPRGRTGRPRWTAWTTREDEGGGAHTPMRGARS